MRGKTAVITGASRGIGKAIALKLARDGANIVIAAKTAQPHPKLAGTIYTAAEEVEKAGGKALPLILDVRDEESVQACVEESVKKFGGIDILINNASAISLTGTVETPMKRYDLMHSINTRGTYMMSQKCIPYLKQSSHAHILNISPPLNMSPKWFGPHVAYTMAKYGMSMCVLGMAEELHPHNIGVNALWPRTGIITAAMEMLGGGGDIADQCRKPEIMADAAYAVLARDPRNFTGFGYSFIVSAAYWTLDDEFIERFGKFVVDDDILREQGVTDFDQYAVKPGHPLLPDFFLEEAGDPEAVARTMAEQGANPVFRDGKAQHTAPLGRTEEQVQARASESSGGVTAVFESVRALLKAEPAIIQSLQSVYQFDIDGGTWHMDLKTEGGAVGEGAPSAQPEVTFTMKESVFVDMFAGKVNPTTAFMSGKMKMKGDLGKAMKLQKLMKTQTSKI